MVPSVVAVSGPPGRGSSKTEITTKREGEWVHHTIENVLDFLAGKNWSDTALLILQKTLTSKMF